MSFPYTFPFEFLPDYYGDYVVEVDWDNAGDFSDEDIDVGSPAINRATAYAGEVTIVMKANPVNFSGHLTEVQIYVAVPLSSCSVAAFYVVDGNNLSTRNYADLGSLEAGLNTKNVDMHVDVGDYLGVYIPAGDSIDATVASGDYWYVAGDKIPCTNQAFLTSTNIVLSLYATGIMPKDITNDVKEIRFTRGKDEELGKANPGTLELRVNNSDGKYSPSLSTGALYGELLPKRAIRVREFGVDGITVLFYGYIETITPHPHSTQKDAFISAIDGLDYLARHELDTILYKDTLTGDLVTNILDASDWSATLRTIDTGQDTVPYAYWSKVKARFALEELEDSELAFIYINGAGHLCFEDRHHRFTETHQTSQATINDTMVEIFYDYSARKVFNEIRATVTPWELKTIAELWRLEETPSIAVGETITIWGDFEFFADEITTPVATTDYTINSQADGGGDDETANVTITTSKFAKSVKLQIQNDAAHIVYVTFFRVRGTYYDSETKVSKKSEDTTSQDDYQKRTLSLDGKYLTDADLAQDYCDYALARFKDPQADVMISIINKNNTLLTQMLSREVSDRITVQNTELGLDKDYFINKIEHEITQGGRTHRCNWYLADAENEDFWLLDFSKLGTGTKISY